MAKTKSPSGSEKSEEPQKVDNLTPVADLHPVVTPEGVGFVAVGGRVYAWDPQDKTWNQSQTGEIKQLKLGADNQLYALTESNALIALDSAGEPLADRLPIQLPEGTRDFAVSPMGSIAFVDNDPEARIGFLGRVDSAEQPAIPLRGDSPLTGLAESGKQISLQSLAFAKDGKLSILDNTGTVWEGSRTTDTPNLNWTATRTALSEKIAVKNKLQQLVTLRSGSVGAIDQKQNILERSGSMWEPVEFNAARAVDKFYNRVHDMNEGNGKRWYVPSMFHRMSVSEQSLSERWRSWAKSHQPIQKTAGIFSNAAQDLESALTHAQMQLRDPEKLPKIEDLPWKNAEAFEASIANKVTDNATDILDKLEQELGTRNQDGTIKQDFRNRRVQASPAVVNSGENVLKQLYDVRRTMFGEADKTTVRLKDLLGQKVFLPIDSKRRLVDASGIGTDLPKHLTKNKYAVWTGKLVHDHAVLAMTAKSANNPNEPLSKEDILRGAELIDGRREENGNQITRLYRANFVNIDRAKRFLEGFDNITAAFKNSDHKLHRAATAQGGTGANTLADSYQQQLHSMSSGETISLQSSSGGMFDLYGVSRFMVPILSPFMQIQGFMAGSAKRTYTFNLTKTDDGVDISVGKGTEVAATPFGVRLRLGLFGEGKLGTAAARVFGYAGFQNIYRLGVVNNVDNLTTFNIKQDDNGKLQGVLEGLLTGKMSPYQLMELSEEARNKRSMMTTTTATVNFELGAGVGGGGSSVNATSQAKHTLAPAAERLIAGGQWEQGKSNERGPGSAHAKKRTSQFQGFVKATHVTDLPGFERTLDKDLWGKSVATDGYTLSVGETGEIDAVTVDVTPKKMAVNAFVSKLRGQDPNKILTEKKVPQLGELLKTNPELKEHIAKLRESDIPFKIEMELKPSAIKQIREYVAEQGNARDENAIHKYIKGIVKKPENLRIKRISATQETTYTTGWEGGIAVLGYQSTATNAFTRSRADIRISYADSDQPDQKPKVKVRGDLLLGEEALPDFSQVNQILRDIDPVRFKFLNDPVGNDPVRQKLAELTGNVRSNLNDDVEKRFSSHDLDQEGVGLFRGHLVYMKQLADGTNRMVDLPPEMSRRIVGEFGASLLVQMSQGETKSLNSEKLPLTSDDLDKLKQLAANPFTPEAKHEPVSKDLDRSLNINDIIDGLRSGSSPSIDPAQNFILTQFFPAEDGSLDLKELGRLLDDPAQVDRFQASIRHAAGRDQDQQSVHKASQLDRVDTLPRYSRYPDPKDAITLDLAPDAPELQETTPSFESVQGQRKSTQIDDVLTYYQRDVIPDPQLESEPPLYTPSQELQSAPTPSTLTPPVQPQTLSAEIDQIQEHNARDEVLPGPELEEVANKDLITHRISALEDIAVSQDLITPVAPAKVQPVPEVQPIPKVQAAPKAQVTAKVTNETQSTDQATKRDPKRDLKREPGFREALVAVKQEMKIAENAALTPGSSLTKMVLFAVQQRLDKVQLRMDEPKKPAPSMPSVRSSTQQKQPNSVSLKPTAQRQDSLPSFRATPIPTPGFGRVKAGAQEFDRKSDVNTVLDMVTKINPKLIPPGNIMDAKAGDSLDMVPGFNQSPDSKVMLVNMNTGDAYVWVPPAPDQVKRKADIYIVNAALQEQMLGPGKRLVQNQSTFGMKAGVKQGQEIEPTALTRSGSESNRSGRGIR